MLFVLLDGEHRGTYPTLSCKLTTLVITVHPCGGDSALGESHSCANRSLLVLFCRFEQSIFALNNLTT